MRVLVLAGTGEGRRLAGLLVGRGCDVVVSLAGRVARPLTVEGARTRIGGFGGADGLAGWLRQERVDALVDATHPFAARMTDAAVAAARETGVPLLVLQRPGWVERDGDDWRRVPSVDAAATSLGQAQRVFLAIGRQELGAFANDAARFFLVRAVDPPGCALPPRSEVVLGRGPFGLDGERALLREHGIDLLVCKDSGGTAAKLDAARELRVPVVMVDRPPAPSGVPLAATIEDAAAWLVSRPGTGPAG